MPIRKLKARQILDARGEPTVEVDLVTDIGLLRSSAPSAVHAAENAAKELRDEDESFYNGRSVLKVVEMINNIIAPELLKSKLDVHQQRDIDAFLQTLDGSPDKSRLGVNAILAVSVACCKASAAKRGLPLYRYIASLCDNQDIYVPVPAFNVIGGGRAAGNSLAYQEFLILPTGAESFSDAIRIGIDIYRQLELKLAEAGELKPPMGVVDEGVFAPELEDDKEALTTISETIDELGYSGKVKIGIDVSASTFCKEGMYDLAFKSEDSDPEDYLDPEAFREQYAELLEEFPMVVSLEDPFDQEDWESWSGLVAAQPMLQVVADELVCTNGERLEELVEKQAATSVLIRLGHAGTVTEALDCVRAAREAGLGVIVSAGEGETEDNFIADFAVGVSAGQFKAGAPCRSERVSKYNQILRIEEELGTKAKYVGEKYRNPFAED